MQSATATIEATTGVDVERSRASRPLDLRARVLGATVRCVARWGVAKTTLDDVAREAGCSRATVYRVVPGGKAALLDAAADAELTALFDRLAAAFDGATSLEALLTDGIVTAAKALADHDALQYLLRHEAAPVLSGLAFDGLDPVLETVAGFAAPWFERHLPPTRAAEVVEWATRVVLLYSLDVDTERPDLAERAEAARIVRTYLLPGIAELVGSPAAGAAVDADADASRSSEATTIPISTTAPQEQP